jgi:Icc-related predicted phosphoesterase
MKLWVLSDLHYELRDLPGLKMADLAIPDADVCVVAGDLTNGCGNAIRWLDQHIATSMPVVFVAGNHEFYGDSILEGREWGHVHAAECPRVRFLDDGEAVIGGVRFLGATFWTDFDLDGDGAWAAANFEGRINDSRQIAWRTLPAREHFGGIRVKYLHIASKRFLTERLSQPFDGPTVVVTHHAPHPGSVHPKYKGSSLNPSFASDQTELIESYRPALWVHGHVHDSFDYRVDDTRVLCNPKGYLNENPMFDPALVVEV